MITIQEAHRYLNLVSDGFAPAIKCRNDSSHPNLVSWFSDKEETEFICLACSFKIRPGLKLSQYIQSVLNNFKN